MSKAERETEEIAGASSASPVSEDEIRLRAYALYESRGHEDGHDLDDWLEAERSLRNERLAA